MQAMKPHSGKVTSIVFDEVGDHMATGGSDNTVFFFATNAFDAKLRPIGFVTVDGSVNSMEFSPKSFVRY